MKIHIHRSFPFGSALAALYLNLILVQPVVAISSWTVASPVAISRSAQTATLLQNGKLLVVGGFDGANLQSSAQIYDPVTGLWSATGSLNFARQLHTATLLPNGKVLVAGGVGTPFSFLTSAELYDPVSGTWTSTGSMSAGRSSATATLLASGKVLVAAGTGSGGTYLASSELYDPATGTWTTTTGSLNTKRTDHAATLLTNGMVLVSGGTTNGVYLSSAELYNPSTETWSVTGSLGTGREYPTATLLASGKVFVVGGIGTGGALAAAELYDPVGGTWSPAAGGPTGTRYLHTATLLPSGKVMVAGGINSTGTQRTSSVEVYDPVALSTVAITPMNTARDQHTATVLADGRVMVVAGVANTGETNSVELYDPTISGTAGAWTTTGALHTARYYPTSTLLTNGKVLVAGGGSILNYYSSAELYDPATSVWTVTNSMSTNRLGHTATLLPSGKVLVAGGITSATSPTYLSTAELFDPATGTWTLTGSMSTARYFHTATLLANGKVLVAGGYGTNSSILTASLLGNAELYDPISGTWTTTTPLITARDSHTATLLPNGKVLVAGGVDGTGVASASSELYDPVGGTWATTAGPLNFGRYNQSATLLPNGSVMVAGGVSRFGDPMTTAEVYNPANGFWDSTGSMNGAHELHAAVLLPNGRVLVAGGVDSTFNTTASAEVYDEVTATWNVTGSMLAPHQSDTATLLPDGQVLVAGGANNEGELPISDAELYDTGLGFNAPSRPQITTATSPLASGNKLALTGSRFRGLGEGSGGNTTQDSPADYPVVQLRSVESGQTLYLLSYSNANWSATSYTSAPVTGMPSGWTLATMFVNGVPSVSTMLDLAGPVPSPIVLTNPVVLPNGTFQCTFTNTPGAVFTGLATTNLTSPPASWTVIATGVAEISSGHFQFTDPQAVNYPQRFYSVRSP